MQKTKLRMWGNRYDVRLPKALIFLFESETELCWVTPYIR